MSEQGQHFLALCMSSAMLEVATDVTIGLSICHTHAPCWRRCTEWDAVWQDTQC